MATPETHDRLTIQSHRGPYSVFFSDTLFDGVDGMLDGKCQFIIDKTVAEIYGEQLRAVLSSPYCVLIEADERNKSLDRFPGHIDALMKKGARRGHRLVAIGGGIIQDITSFIAATLFRGIDWSFYPTTLLAQADSCIGSKSSINVGTVKNLIGTFTPPKEIFISMKALSSLREEDIRSGVGEIIKVHILDGAESFRAAAGDYERILKDGETLKKYIFRSLEIKKKFIEEDEFDKELRNLLNYGHSFGHAVEAATRFEIPHGIAVTMGMDMANFTAREMGRISEGEFSEMHALLKKNYRGFENVRFDWEAFSGAIRKDKKNTASHLALILLKSPFKAEKVKVLYDGSFLDLCKRSIA